MRLQLVLIVSSVLGAAAMCPNACSGHGTCGEYDMCSCFTNWQANDCSERTCPFAEAFTTTPNGDLNMDGDRYDNTMKMLVKTADRSANMGTMMENDDTLTLSADINTAELIVGDAIRIADETFVVTAVDSASQYVLDHDRYTAISDSNVYKHLETVNSPNGTWEMWAGDYNADDDEGHFYMECANRGLCDRKLGECECFDGYSGAACHRQACPNSCSGHGTCETVGELLTLNATLLPWTLSSATSGSATLAPSVDPTTVSTASGVTTALVVGDTIRVGSQFAQDLVVTAVSSTSITTNPASDKSFGFGTRVYHKPVYDLWDRDMDRACMCDLSYTGGDCSLRACPRGDDPLTVYSTPTHTTSFDAGTLNYKQRNEKQNIYLDTQRGQLSGTFTLTFTDAFGQRWTTNEIYVNERLSSKAYVSAGAMDTVTFSPALPYGELDAGDFLMIGDERREVATVYPIVSTTLHRPIKLGGVIDSVLVRNVYSAASSNVHSFRAGPAKGIKAALLALPDGAVPSVVTEDFKTGTLIGYHRGGIATASGMTTILGVQGSYENQGTTENTALGNRPTMSAYNGGLAPYDMVRVTASGGYTEFMQLRNVDIFGDGTMEAVMGKGTLTAASANTGGIGAGTTGAIYRAGGYHVRVEFTGNSGDLPEMEVDESGLFSVFLREFTGTVARTEPRRVYAHLHGGNSFNADTVYGDAGAQHVDGEEDGAGQGSVYTFKGNLGDLKVMAGMKVRLGDQTRLVVSDIDSSATTTYPQGLRHGTPSFYVDQDFDACDVSETVGDVAYLFYRYPVEQLFDEATYAMLTMSKALFLGTTTLAGDGVPATYATPLRLTISAAIAAGAGTSWAYSGVDDATDLATMFGTALPASTFFSLKCSATNAALDGDYAVTGIESTTQLMVAKLDSTSSTASQTGVTGCVFRVYESMSARDHCTAYSGVYSGAPPAHNNHKSNWATITDQRPLLWSTPDIGLTTSRTGVNTINPAVSRITYSPSRIAERGVVAGGSSFVTFPVNPTTGCATTNGGGLCLTTSNTGTTLTLTSSAGYAGSIPDLTKLLGTGSATDGFWFSVSGCSNYGANVYDGTFKASAITGNSITYVAQVPGHTDNQADLCMGNTVTITSRMGGLIDAKAIAIDDRVRVLQGTAAYETRTVDKIWGSSLDVTVFSVSQAYQDTTDLQDLSAWVDESGSTEQLECSRRGLCAQEEGTCTCFSGYTGYNCGIQNALAS